MIESRYLYWWLVANYLNIRNMAGGEARDGLNLDPLGGILVSSEPRRQRLWPTPRPCDHKDRQAAAKKRTLIERLKEKRHRTHLAHGHPRPPVERRPRRRPRSPSQAQALRHRLAWRRAGALGGQALPSLTSPPRSGLESSCSGLASDRRKNGASSIECRARRSLHCWREQGT